MIMRPIEQIPGVYHRWIGDILVTALSDGFVDMPYEVFRNASPSEAEAALSSLFRPAPPRISVNCFLIRTKDRIALVDTGSAESMGPTLGKLPQSLAAAGVAAVDIDTVLLTHIHPDHSNGLTSASGTRVFDNAEIVVSEKEFRHWHDDAAMARADEAQKKRHFQAGRFQTSPYANRRKDARGEVFPGVVAVPAPGHTPGHTAYLVSSGDESLLIWGDVCHVPEVQLRTPSVTVKFDSDPSQAAATRLRLLDMAASDKQLVTGMHLHFPGFLRLKKQGEGYVDIPDAWSFGK